jgi:hypothetical protein
MSIASKAVNFNSRFSKRSMDMSCQKGVQSLKNKSVNGKQINFSIIETPQHVQSKENSLTRPYQPEPANKSRIQRTNSSLNLSQSKAPKKKAENRVFDRKKSSALRNTTLEEISEA